MGSRGLRSAAPGLVALLLACGSGGVHVEHTHSPDAEFERYATYGWSTASGELTGSAWVDDWTDVRIRSAIDLALARRGLSKVSSGAAPDLTVGYLARVDGPLAPRRDPAAAATPSDRWFEEGSLEVGLVDPRAERVVWKGLARMELDRVGGDPADRDRRIHRVVSELFKDFPPR